jgi:hypothetical protein
MDTPPHHNPGGPGPPSRPDAARRSDHPALRLRELLAEVGKGPTRLELACWQLNVDEPRARPAWDLPLRLKLIEPIGSDRLTGEAAVFTLTDRGRRALRNLSRHRGR